MNDSILQEKQTTGEVPADSPVCQICLQTGRCRKEILLSQMEWDAEEGLAITHIVHELHRITRCLKEQTPEQFHTKE